MLSINTVADYFILRNYAESFETTGDIITHLKLQKLCYYAQAWHLALYNKKLINENFQAWVHGPVCESLYKRFASKDFMENITNKDMLDDEVMKRLTHDQSIHLNNVWGNYGIYTGKYLERLTHEELPWQEARVGLKPIEPSKNIIKTKTMQEFYKKMNEENS